MRNIDVQKVFVFETRGDNITIMLPMTEADKAKAINVIKTDGTAEMECGITMTEKRILMLGDTSEIKASEATKLGVESKWYFAMNNFKTRECKVNDNGFIGMTEYTNPVEMIKLASGMLGNPKEAIILKMKLEQYHASDFYNNEIKPHTHG